MLYLHGQVYKYITVINYSNKRSKASCVIPEDDGEEENVDDWDDIMLENDDQQDLQDTNTCDQEDDGKDLQELEGEAVTQQEPGAATVEEDDFDDDDLFSQTYQYYYTIILNLSVLEEKSIFFQ